MNYTHITNEQLKARTALYLTDTDELIDYHFPTYPNVVYVGGVATRPADQLTGELKLFMDSAINGTVLVFFVTLITSLPKAVSEKLFGVSKVAKIRNRYNQVPHLTQDTNGKVTNSQKTPQTRAKRSALSQQVTTKHI